MFIPQKRLEYYNANMSGFNNGQIKGQAWRGILRTPEKFLSTM